MRNLKLFNTLSRKVEEFEAINPPQVGMYSCGPTVYDNSHIGHMRTYVGTDILRRILKYNGLEVKHVMNITDVGHLVSDADTGEDKMEKGAKKYGLTVWDIAKKFEKQFFDSTAMLNIERPSVVVKATDRIQDQIDLIKILEEKGFTYKIKDGIYFDTTKFPKYYAFSGQNPDELKAGARVEVVKGKKHPADFALWKFSPVGERRQMEWDSPWGKGFPGWHIECSAMSMRELGVHFDIHTGGVDHINVHHTNEIAQSEAASGQKFVNYWVHFGHLLIENEKMSKSLENLFTVSDVVDKGYNPLSLRYLFMQTHYRQDMNFTWEALSGAETALRKLLDEAQVFGAYPKTTPDLREPSKKVLKRWHEFEDAINNDMNMADALAALHQGLKERVDDFDTLFLLGKADQILGLEFKLMGSKMYAEREQLFKNPTPLQQEVLELVKERATLRKQKKFLKADVIRSKIKKLGYAIEDVKGKTEIRKI